MKCNNDFLIFSNFSYHSEKDRAAVLSENALNRWMDGEQTYKDLWTDRQTDR